ncbi:MAG: hypothetical protein MZU84_00845 [Sphingobacterium sp.]|nr:hypothetical protein [Sphingobacterium sp.]
MPSRRVAWVVALVAAVLAVAGCSGRGAAARAAAAGAAPVGSSDPCVTARQQRARAQGLIGEGRLHRTLRALAEADRRCPAERPVTWAIEVEALAELGRSEAARELARTIEGDPRATEADRAAARRALALIEERDRVVPNPDALYAAARDAKRAGRAAEAQRLLDRAVSELERNTGAEVTTDAPERMYRASVTWSPDGALLAVTDGMDVVVREAAALRERVRLGGHGSAVSAVAFSPDGSTLVTGSARSRGAPVPTAGTGRPWGLWWSSTPRLTAVAFSGDGRTIFLGFPYGALRWTRAEDGAALGSLPARQPPVLSVPSPDGSLVAELSPDGSLGLRRARDGEVLHVLAGDPLRIASVTSLARRGHARRGLGRRLPAPVAGARRRRAATARPGDGLMAGGRRALARMGPRSPSACRGPCGCCGPATARSCTTSPRRRATRASAPSRSRRTGARSPRVRSMGRSCSSGCGMAPSCARSRGTARSRTASRSPPDGRTLATGTYQEAIRLWRARGRAVAAHAPGRPGAGSWRSRSRRTGAPSPRPTTTSSCGCGTRRGRRAPARAPRAPLPDLRGRLLAGSATPRHGLGQRPGRAALQGRGRGAATRAPGPPIQHHLARVLGRRGHALHGHPGRDRAVVAGAGRRGPALTQATGLPRGRRVLAGRELGRGQEARRDRADPSP